MRVLPAGPAELMPPIAWPGSGTPSDELPFFVHGLRRGELAGLALGLLRQQTGRGGRDETAGAAAPGAGGQGGRMVLLAEDRAVYATALLASLAGGAELILPYSSSATQLAELSTLLPFGAVLGDSTPEELPSGLRVLQLAAGPSGPAPGGGALATLAAPLSASRPPDQALVYLYTGGSTGRPRLWSKTPANLLAEACFLARRFGLGPGDRLLATVPPHHIYGLLFSVLLPLVSGAAVIRRTVFFPREIAELCRTSGCTVLVSIPAHYRALAAAGVSLGPLRLAFSSAAPLEERDALAFQRVTGVGITEIFGSTETGGIASRCRASGETFWTPFAALRWRAEDQRLCVDSPYLSAELPRDEAGFFRTGDRAVAAGGGEGFQLLGRADGIVKVGGKRVDLGEIEEKLNALPGVQDGYALALPVPDGRQEAIAVLVVASLSPEEILEQLRPQLPSQAWPRLLRLVEHIPLTPAGKRDRLAAEQLLLAERRGI